MGIIQSHLGPLIDIDGFIQIIPGNYKSDRPINFTAIDEVHLKSDCNNGSIVNGIGEPILFNLGLDKPPGHKKYKKPRIELFRKSK